MKILSNKVWEAILDIARENDRKILELEAERVMKIKYFKEVSVCLAQRRKKRMKVQYR